MSVNTIWVQPSSRFGGRPEPAQASWGRPLRVAQAVLTVSDITGAALDRLLAAVYKALQMLSRQDLILHIPTVVQNLVRLVWAF